MADTDKTEGFIDKTVDFFTEAGDKITDYAKEHEFDEKIDKATNAIEKGARDIFNGLKNSFSKND